MPIYTFPRKVIDSLAEFANYGPTEVAELAEFIESNLEALASPEVTYERATDESFKALGSSRAFRSLDTLVPLVYSVLSNSTDSKAAIGDVLRAFVSSRTGSDSAETKATEKRLKKNIAKLFDNATIRLKAKSIRLLSSHENNFSECEIISDVRPVFSADGKINIEAAVFFHTLRIGYSNERENFYVTMDAADLRKLRTALDRAIQKEESLAKFIERAGVEHVKVI